MTTFTEATWRAAAVTRWIARVAGTLVTLFFLAFLVGEGPPPLWRLSLQQNLQFLGMCGLCTGLITAWKWEGLGGVITMASYGLLLTIDRHFNATWLFAVPAVIGLIHILCWLRLHLVGSRAVSPWNTPRLVLEIGGALTGVFILLSANEIFLNPPLMTPTLHPPSNLVGFWRGHLPSGITVEVQISENAAVRGQIGQKLIDARIFNNRSWFGDLMNWREPYMIRGTGLEGGVSLQGGKLSIGVIETEQNPFRITLQQQ